MVHRNMNAVREVLARHEQNRSEAAEVIKVDKLIPLECYLQDLLVVDTNEINVLEFRRNKEEHVLNLARDCVQHLINTISSYPDEIHDGKVFRKLPGPLYDLPREKPIPIAKPLTKWEQFAKEKGIRKTKKTKSTWDDVLQRWIPTYGYRKAAAEKEKNWLLEVPSNVDPNTDMFAEKTKTKKENIAKNEYQRLRNIAAARKIKVPKVAVLPMEGNLHVSQLQVAADVAQVSTASLGKFQPKLPQDKNVKPSRNVGNRKKKRLLSTDEERKANLNIAEKILKKKPKIDIMKAVNKHLHEEETQRDAEKSNKKRSKKKKRFDNDGSKKNKNSFKRSKSSKGQRMGGKQKSSGRKRR